MTKRLPRHESPARRRGVALVSVLLVVAIATVLAVGMVREQAGSIQVAHGFLQRGQALQYALGGEELARQILREDFEAAPGRDHLAETWASPAFDFEFEEGVVDITITDLQGRINVNSLSERNPGADLTRQRLLNLVAAAGGDPSIVDQAQDWIDADDGARALGAEDFEHLALDPPRRTASALMADISEVRLMPGLSLSSAPAPAHEIYQRLSPALTALPEAATNINVNTASPLALQSLAAGLGYDAAQALATRRDEEGGFESVSAFLQSPELAGLGVADTGLGVQSSFFEVRVVARYQGRYSHLTSIVQRNPTDGNLRVIRRDFSRSVSRSLATGAGSAGDGSGKVADG